MWTWVLCGHGSRNVGFTGVFCSSCPHNNVGLLRGFPENAKRLISGFESMPQRAVGESEFLQRLLFHLQIQLDVLVSGRRRRMAQQERNDGDIHFGLEQVHRSGVAQRMGRDAPTAQRRTSWNGSSHG